LSDGDGNPRLQIDANGDVGIGSAASISTRFEVSSPYYGARISGTEAGINYPQQAIIDSLTARIEALES
jgi:hypothetical protein